MGILENLYKMTAFQEIFNNPGYLLMLAIGAFLLYLGIHKKYEPLLLVPIAFGVILANLPGGTMGVVTADHINLADGTNLNLLEIAHEYGIMNFLYYSLIKTGFLPPIIFMGIGALTDFGPMLRLSLIHISEPTRLGMISYAVFC